MDERYVAFDVETPNAQNRRMSAIGVSVIEGEGTIGGRAVRRGTHLIIPAAYGDACCEGKMRLVVSRVPTSL